MSDAYPITERNRVKRLHPRGSYDRAAVHAVLDAAPLCHVGYVIDGQPYVTPTLHWRDGDRVYWHGSSASRFLRQAEGSQVCLTVSLIDAFVLARSAFHHSVNYRSAMLFGTARQVEGTQAKAAALKAMIDSLYPGRWDGLRPMTEQEVKATSVLWMDIEAASAKVRTGGPNDDEDVAHPVWAGVMPFRQGLEAPIPELDLPHGLDTPETLKALAASGRFRAAREDEAAG